MFKLGLYVASCLLLLLHVTIPEAESGRTAGLFFFSLVICQNLLCLAYAGQRSQMGHDES